MVRTLKSKIPAMIAMAVSSVSFVLVLIALVVSLFETPIVKDAPGVSYSFRFWTLSLMAAIVSIVFYLNRCYPNDRRSVLSYSHPSSRHRGHSYDCRKYSHVCFRRRESRNKHPYLEPVLRRYVRPAGVLHTQDHS